MKCIRMNIIKRGMLETVVDVAYLMDEGATQDGPIIAIGTMGSELPDLLIFIFKRNQNLRFLYKIS